MAAMVTTQLEQRAYVMPELDGDAETRLQAAAFMGRVLAGREFELIENQETIGIESLYDALQWAYETGDEEALNMITANVRTDVIERTIKAGFVMSVDLSVNDEGQIQQFGQSLQTIQKNSLRHMADHASPEMLGRTRAETYNSWRLQAAYDEGLLEDYAMVVISRAPDDMSRQAAAKAGFFTETMSCAIQVTTAQNGKLTCESAFVAGVSENGERHDAQAVAHLGDCLRVELDGLSATELLNKPLLVHKSLMPNGAVDLVQLYDQMSGGFFGMPNVPRKDYPAFREKCRERETLLAAKVDRIVSELVAEAPHLKGPAEATRRLAKISEKHMVQQAAFDSEIDPRVFGREAATYIYAARDYYERGDLEMALYAVRYAEKTAISSSCPDGVYDGITTDGNPDGKADNETPGDCEFVSKSCPKCGTKNVLTVVSKGEIKGACGCKARLAKTPAKAPARTNFALAA